MRQIKLKFLFLSLLLSFGLLLLLPEPAYALCKGRCCNCNSVRNAIMGEVQKHQQWLLSDFWGKNIEPEIKKITARVQSFQLGQSGFQGGFIDAQSMLRAKLAQQSATIGVEQNYAPSEQVCRMGSLSQSLAASRTMATQKQLDLVEASLNRHTQKQGESSAEGTTQDLVDRYERFKGKFCDIKSYAEGFSFCSKASDVLVNLDIDYTRLIDTQNTISDAEEEAIAPMMQNLFGARTFQPINSDDLKSGNANARDKLMDQRALIAKRSVAENSFAALAARRTNGSAGSMESMKALLKEMGVDKDEDAVRYLTANPSYEAQMEFVTKKLYQSEGFFKNLMENPANLNRQFAAMQSFGLMQSRDIYDSVQRSEMILSLIVEMELEKLQRTLTTPTPSDTNRVPRATGN